MQSEQNILSQPPAPEHCFASHTMLKHIKHSKISSALLSPATSPVSSTTSASLEGNLAFNSANLA